MFTKIMTPAVYHTDGLRHINNIGIAMLFEEARNPIFRIFNPDLKFENWDLIMVSLCLDFVHQMYYGTDIEIRTGISRIGNSSFDIYQEAWQNGVLCTKGTAVSVYYNFETQKSRPLTTELHQKLLEHTYPEK